MKQIPEVPSINTAHFAGKRNTGSGRSLVLRSLSLMIFLLAFGFVLQGQNGAQDPGPRTGNAQAGTPIAGLTADQTAYFNDGLSRFQEVESVQNGAHNGLGPTFNSNSCSSCHAQPAIGGSSPAVNPQVQVANAEGATNTIPSFITLNGPVREARFKFATGPNGRITNTPDGGVHGLFTIQGRSDATGCTLAQPDFQRMVEQNNISFRIPTPTFGEGLIESISENTIIANQAAESAWARFLGISGHPNRSGNDGSITRFGWKAQNKSLTVFTGEAYNVEMGITNELFPNERGYPPTPLPASCLFNPSPEDGTNFDATTTTQVPSDVVAFSAFMRFLDQPAPSCTGSGCSASIQNGRHIFTDVAKCAVCHTPSMTTGTSYVAALSNVQANLFSDLLVHNMGQGLADGVSQGGAGPDEFRTAPLWGLGQRIFFLHDGRTSDLLQAIEAHASQGSEANGVIRIFNGLTQSQKQDLLNFLRSL
ncbi:MAG: thiol oxidoreductase [Acidobacteriia bacterium]|nr:thiol oxidoreductase [Terriglobia bacterium]